MINKVSQYALSLLFGFIFLPLTLNGGYKISGCVLPAWGCTQNDGERVEVFTDGSFTLNGLLVCAQPKLGCTLNPLQSVTLFEDGSVIVKSN
jgi:hypothetical protein